jgi:hypothetical protein
MAKTIEVELKAKTDKAVKEIESLQKEVKKLNEQVSKGNKNTAEGLKDVKKSSDGVAKGVGKIGTAMKAAGIGLAVAAFAKLAEVFNENQKVADFFNTTFEALSLAFNDFFNFLDSNVGTVIGYFKSIFDDPVQSIKNLGTSFKNNIIERFNSAIDTLGYLGSAVKKFFEGDWDGAVEQASLAGKEYIDVLTGVDGSFEKIKDVTTKVTGSIVEYTKSTIKAAAANVDLQKTADLATVKNQGLIEKYDLQAEKLRQVRDEERNTIEERIQANNDLNAVLDEQEKAMLANANAILAAAQVQFNKNKNLENEIALLEAKNEVAAVEAQIAGFRSEQKANDLALDREKLELATSISDAEAEREQAQRDFEVEMIDGEARKLQRRLDDLEIVNAAEEKRLTEQRDLYKKGTQAWVDANNELLTFKQASDLLEKKMDKDLQKSKMASVEATLGTLAGLAGENSKFGKALAVVQAIMDTYKGANLALGSAPPPFNFIQMAAVIAAGFVNVKNILKTKPPPAPSFAKGGAGGDAGIAAPSPPPAPTPPDINTVASSGMNQLADAIGDQVQQPVQAYVVSNDVTTAQSLERNIVDGASI